jgi:cyanophycinase-like exopeptidase
VTAGPIALVGSGEYLPVMQDLEGGLIAGRAARYVQIPTAAALEGQQTLDRWIRLGQEQAARLGVEAVPVVVRDRDEADDPELAALVHGAGLVYLSGGNPPYLAETLRGTRVWAAVVAAWEAGAALAGCSAGAMALTGWAPHVQDLAREPDPGLQLVPGWHVIPHFDRMAEWEPRLVERVLEAAPAGTRVLGIDEETAVVQQDGGWVVHGRQAVWLLTPEGRQAFHAGDVLPDQPVG